MKKSFVSVVFAILAVVLLNFVSAELLIGQIDSFYHLGDEMNVSVTVSPLTDKNDFLSVKMICISLIVSNSTNTNQTTGYNASEIDIFRIPMNAKAGESKNAEFSVKLDKFLIGELRGLCSLRANYGAEEANSAEFEISNLLDVSSDISGVAFNPRESFSIKGSAYRQKGGSVNGFVEAKVLERELVLNGIVEDGIYEVNFTIPSDMKSGKYNVKMWVYEKDNNGEVINEGFSEESFSVKQLVKKLELKIDSQSVIPGNEFKFTPSLRDQVGDEILGDIIIDVYMPDNSVFLEKLFKAGQEQSIKTEYNYTPGYWSIEAKAGNISTNKLFLVEDLMVASFTLENNTLVIKNIGNVRYTKPVEITIGGVSEIKELDLGLSEEKRFRLSAPDGDYNVEINDGTTAESLGTAFLTGNAIRIGDATIGEALKDKMYLIIWFIVFVILGIVALIIYRKIIKKKLLNAPHKLITPVNVSAVKSNKDEISTGHGIDSGKREEGSIITLKIRNLRNIESMSRDPRLTIIDHTLLRAKEAGVKIYVSGDNRIIIFSPILTKQADNSTLAIKTAKYMANMLNNYNSKSDKKIDFGIGVNTGEIIVEKKEGKFSFTAVGNTIQLSKRAAESSKGDVLISKATRDKVAGKVKTQKEPEGDFFIVLKTGDDTRRNEFIDRMQKRKEERK